VIFLFKTFVLIHLSSFLAILGTVIVSYIFELDVKGISAAMIGFILAYALDRGRYKNNDIFYRTKTVIMYSVLFTYIMLLIA